MVLIASQLFRGVEDDPVAGGTLSVAGRVRLLLLSRPLPTSLRTVTGAPIPSDISIEAVATAETLMDLQVLNGTLVMLEGRPGWPSHPARLLAFGTRHVSDSELLDTEQGSAERGVLYCSPILLHNLQAHEEQAVVLVARGVHAKTDTLPRLAHRAHVARVRCPVAEAELSVANAVTEQRAAAALRAFFRQRRALTMGDVLPTQPARTLSAWSGSHSARSTARPNGCA